MLQLQNGVQHMNRMKLVELMGPSGVGKTSVLKHAVLKHVYEWIPVNEIPFEWFFEDKKSFNRAVRQYIDEEIPDFLNVTYEIIFRSTMQPSQKLKTIKMLEETVERAVLSRYAVKKGYTVVSDELFLHRAFSFLIYSDDLEKDARQYFNFVPMPVAAVIMQAAPETILERVKQRARQVNCYYKKNEHEILTLIHRALRICEIANIVLCERGVNVKELVLDNEIEEEALQLNDFICGCLHEAKPDKELRMNIIPLLKNAAKSFRKKQGRHIMFNSEVMYCSFSTPRFVVHPEESERDAIKRYRKFRINKDIIEGKSVLDLGCNTGAMLFQATNFNISYGMGIEYDSEKIKVANEIMNLSDIRNLEFRQADIDQLEGSDIGEFDIVFCLAVVAHVMDEEHLFELLGKVTKQRLYFEGNSNTDIRIVRKKLSQLGFEKILEFGMCDDDIRPRNNNRPLLVALKA